jgi:EAL domain-containing protein (putative c-di-GMP-specific phosphodiesterase class I)
VEQGRLFLALQPVVNSDTGVTDQYEALLRIDDDAGGFSDAHLLVSAAERFGLIKNIDKWVCNYPLNSCHVFVENSILIERSFHDE